MKTLLVLGLVVVGVGIAHAKMGLLKDYQDHKNGKYYYYLNIFESDYGGYHWQVLRCDGEEYPCKRFHWYYGERISYDPKQAYHPWRNKEECLKDWEETAYIFHIKWSWIKDAKARHPGK